MNKQYSAQSSEDFTHTCTHALSKLANPPVARNRGVDAKEGKEFDFSLISNKENRKCALEENSEIFNKLVYSEDIQRSVQESKGSQSTGLMKSIRDAQINSINPNPVGATGTFGTQPFSTDRSSSRLDTALKRLNEYNKELSRSRHAPHDSGYQLVGTLENELADIISLLQSERVAQSEEITKLNAEIHKLNKRVRRQGGEQSREDVNARLSSVQEAKVKGLEELLRRMHKECFDYKNQLFKMQDTLKNKDKIIEEVREKCEGSERECEKLQAEVAYLKGILNARENEKADGNNWKRQAKPRQSEERTREHSKSKQLLEILKEKNKEITELRRNLDNLKTERRSTYDPIINKRSSEERYLNERMFEGLISKVQNLENLITRNQSRDFTHNLKPYEKTEENRISSEIRELKEMMANMEQKYSSQYNCTRNLQDSKQECNGSTSVADIEP
eukprot:TRINITY_DN3173_c0_g1_i1.p1 TRINITY_DN3173_c0_g1~~TRINITY_DN3173_c0_g1_i1.p1  ORF type:complete len:470 (+),score=100.79 TRINITY_DN3173_c0_g1_i1:67-1410(+)